MNRRWGKLHLYSGKPSSRPAEKQIFALLKADDSTHIDEIVERLEPALSSSEIFAALFELELAGTVKQLPGKNFMETF
jgi:DNA processing protein